MHFHNAAAERDHARLLSMYRDERWPEVLVELVNLKQQHKEAAAMLARLWERYAQDEVKA